MSECKYIERAKKYPDCPLRDGHFNCKAIKKFCFNDVDDEMCEAIHLAYDIGYIHGGNVMKSHMIMLGWNADNLHKE